MGTIGLWQITNAGPSRLSPGAVGLERDLEQWIEQDPSLLEQGLVIVGRQLMLDAGRLDLLALDPQGRWVLIELKRERLRRETVAQAVDYASCLDRLDANWLRERCNAYLASRASACTLDGLLEERGQSLGGQEERLDLVIYLVGTGADVGLERMAGYLQDRGNIALRIVTFAVFQDACGNVLLEREIHEESREIAPPRQQASRPQATADGVLALADANGVGAAVRVLSDVAAELGFATRPYVKSLMFAPPQNRTRCLFVVWVDRRAKEPGVAKVFVAADAFEEFYGIAQQDLTAAIGFSGYGAVDEASARALADALRRVMGEAG